MPKYYKVQNSTIMYLNSSFNCIKSNSITITKTSGGSGYTGAAVNVVITSALNDNGTAASATATASAGAIATVTMVNGGYGYNIAPTISITGGGSPGVITGYSALSGGSGYALPPLITATNGVGSNFAGYTTLAATTLSSTFTITSGGTGYAVNDTLNFNYTGTGGGSNVVAKVSTVSSGVITGITLTNAGGGFTLKPPTISSITSSAGSGAVITCSLVAAAVGTIVITNGGMNYNTTVPTFVFTAVSGGSGASATATINLGTAAVLTASFNKCYTYTWNGIPPVIVNDLARLSAINIIATGFNTSTPYTYRILGVQYDSRDSFFSDYGQPILSMAQNVNVCSYGSLGGGQFCIILTPQTINSITISVDDDIATKGSGQAASINFVIAIEIEEYDPNMTEIGDVYAESVSRIKNGY